ncbi:MAG TPA: metal ABC transporter permease [Candidatus Nanoarchaeia archaeon]|nr:metal ABC transporter permease [Candidatus Nanoarchaeia archaeon]
MIEALSYGFLQYGFMQKALLGGIAIALCCGLVGPFLVLRRLSLLGDGLAHLAFGGVALGLLLGVNPIIAALITVVLGSFWVRSLVKKNIYGDAAIALLLSLGVGLGVVIIGIVRGFNTNLYSYLIGSILALSITDIIIAFSLLMGVIIFLLFFYRDMFHLTFNEELAQLSRKNIPLANFLFTILIAMVVVVSIRAVGILLVSALLVIPTLVALNISKSFKQTLLISSISSIVAVIFGIIFSFIVDIPPSGSIVLLLFVGFFGTQMYKKLA